MDLRRLILILAVMSALVTLANGFFATYQVQRQLLIDDTLEANRNYAAKLADTTNLFFVSLYRQLAYSSAMISADFGNSALLQSEAQRLLLQTNSFNSVAVVNAEGVVLATSPESIQIKGRKLTTPGALQALRIRVPNISEPYVSVTGNLLIFISSPVFAEDGTYLGYVGGTIYLKQKSILNEMLGQNFHGAGSYTYVVDDERKIIYHDDAARIGQPMAHGELSTAVQRQGRGSLQEASQSGINILAGFAAEPLSHWTIITIRTTDNTLMSLRGLMLSVLHRTLPLTLLTLVAAWLFARLISQPLWLLARSANDMDRTGIFDDITRIPSWYFEVAQLKRAMLVGISLLQKKIGTLKTEVQTDPLTGLHNRRGLSLALAAYSSANQGFAVIAFDIDKFKKVNDTYGHDVGDQVLKCMAQQLRACSRSEDVLCRIGGEEFLMLLPATPMGIATDIAERLRTNIAATDFPSVGRVYISAGVALWSPEAGNPEQALKQADDALYRAKAQGRNQVVVA
ncbi:diguanylate cyclase [Sodalis sp. RH16]|uniref:sensor domain-containing diguanylate cyclase n=1 Tax=Sodalis sp. RH16 TaxID=3394331 RepID=UPI0039B5712B